MLCCRIKLRDIIVAKKEVWENKQTNMIAIARLVAAVFTILAEEVMGFEVKNRRWRNSFENKYKKMINWINVTDEGGGGGRAIAVQRGREESGVRGETLLWQTTNILYFHQIIGIDRDDRRCQAAQSHDLHSPPRPMVVLDQLVAPSSPFDYE